MPFEFSGEVYWRWYLLPLGEAEQFMPKQPVKIQVEKPKVERKPVKKNEFFEQITHYLGENNISNSWYHFIFLSNLMLYC